MHFINNRNEEIQAKILEFSADRMQQPLHVLISGMWQFYCQSYFALISLCYMVITRGHRTRVAAVTLDNMAERVSAQREDLP